MRKNVSVFSLAVLMAGATIYLLAGPNLFGRQTEEPVCDQGSYRITRAEVLLKPVKVEAPSGMTTVTIESEHPPDHLAPRDTIHILLDSSQGIVVGTVFTIGPYPSLTVLVKSADAKKIRKAKSVAIGVIEWPKVPIKWPVTPCVLPVEKNFE
jgi:hypothetical protein